MTLSSTQTSENNNSSTSTPSSPNAENGSVSNLNNNTENPKKQKVALVTGITGQDGSYLAELLLEKGYLVYGLVRRSSTTNTQRIDHISKNNKNLILETGDLLDSNNLFSVISRTKPDEIYNLAAQSFVKVSFDQPEFTSNVDGLGTLRILESIRSSGLIKTTKFYQASTSEMFGKVQENLQNEKTPFYPRSPYGVAKVFAHWMTINYRESYGLFACNGILFNHESPRRGIQFVTRKISLAVARIHLGLQEYVSLGNLNSRRDWGHARDYVEGMWLMLQQEQPDDYVLSSGETHSVKEFVERAFDAVNVKILWRGEGVNEEGYEVNADGKETIRVKVDPQYYRPAEVDFLLGDNSKAKKHLGWNIKVTFPELVKDMVLSDIDLIKQNANII